MELEVRAARPGRWIRFVPVVAFAVLAVAEQRRPLRIEVGIKSHRRVTNLFVGVASAAAAAMVSLPLMHALDEFARRRRWGLLRRVAMPRWLAIAVTAITLDYSLWWWHRMNHHFAWLWRFHEAHHADIDLDASTALRFHAGELLLGTPVRILPLVVLGVPLRTVQAWESVLFGFIAFHHSNVQLGDRLEAALQNLVMTPRAHGVHHSAVAHERNSNFGTIFAWWDRLHGTRSPDGHAQGIRIGVGPRTDRRDVRARDVLRLPFVA